MTSTPNDSGVSPADEQPAVEGAGVPSDPGVGPAHVPGTTRGEDVGDGDDRADGGDQSASDGP